MELPAGILDVAATHLPGRRVESVVLLGEGCDNTAFEINGNLIVRISKGSDPFVVDREARLLTAVAEISPLPVPEPVFVIGSRGCLAYRKLPGIPLLSLAARQLAAHARTVAAALGGLLAALHAVAPDRLTGVVEADEQSLTEWLTEAADLYPGVVAHVPSRYRRRIEEFFDTQPPDETSHLVFSHNDLGAEHVLVGPDATVTGVIDWTDAALTDPAYDFGLIYRDLGPQALDAALDAYGKSGDLAQRAVFFARCSVLEDLAFGVETGRTAYLDKSLDALSWLFPTTGDD